MNADTLALIRNEVEKIEKDPGFGKVSLTIEHGKVVFIHPTPTIKVDTLDNKRKTV